MADIFRLSEEGSPKFHEKLFALSDLFLKIIFAGATALLF